MRGRGGATHTGRRAMLGAVRVTMGPRGRSVSHTLAKRTLGDDTTLTPAPVEAPSQAELDALNKTTQEIIKRLDEDARYRQYALAIGAASALFAAVKLGLIAFPILRSRRTA